LNAVGELIPDPSPRFPCEGGARHHTRSRFHAIGTLIEEG
jgi:hypothetical protein